MDRVRSPDRGSEPAPAGKGLPGTARLKEMPPGRMCQYTVNLTDAREVDAEVVGWVRRAFDSAG